MATALFEYFPIPVGTGVLDGPKKQGATAKHTVTRPIVCFGFTLSR